MVNMKYLLNCRSFISLMVLFSFFDNFGMDDYISNFKVVFIGYVDVGKTQIFNRIIENTFFEEYNPSMSTTFNRKTINFNGENIKLELWDTSGNKNFKQLAKIFYSNSNLIVFVYAIDDKKTFKYIQDWVEEIKKENVNAKFLLVGNKCDLEDQRKVTTEEAKQYAKTNNMKFIEVSAKKGTNIEKMFNSSLLKFLEDMEAEEKKEEIQVENHIKDIDINHINNNDLPFCNKYCSCCPCL